MKELWLVRHAKSSWSDFSLPDHDRPLNARGKRDAPFMAKHLMNQHTLPDLFISSTAKRAKKTAKHFIEEMKVDSSLLELTKNLYHANPHEIISELHQINEGVERAAIFCHNPGITYLVNQLIDETIDNIPTCGVAIIRSQAEFWATFETDICDLKAYYFPKMFKHEE